jgi:hypothetical protein
VSQKRKKPDCKEKIFSENQIVVRKTKTKTGFLFLFDVELVVACLNFGSYFFAVCRIERKLHRVHCFFFWLFKSNTPYFVSRKNKPWDGPNPKITYFCGLPSNLFT